jgi:hypothetical protein
MKIPPLAYPNPHRRAPPTARYSHWYCEPAFESAFEQASLSVDFWLVGPSRSCEFWHTSTAWKPGLGELLKQAIDFT